MFPFLLLIVEVSSDGDRPAATAAELAFPTMNPSTKMLETRLGVGGGGDMLLLVVVVLALVLLLVVVDPLGVVATVVCAALVVLEFVEVLLGAVDVEVVVVTVVDLSEVIVGFNLRGTSVFLGDNFGEGAGVVFCVTGDAGLGQRDVFFVVF